MAPKTVLWRSPEGVATPKPYNVRIGYRKPLKGADAMIENMRKYIFIGLVSLIVGVVVIAIFVKIWGMIF